MSRSNKHTFYPLPNPLPKGDRLNVYLCFNHLQVMTDAMPPLAQSILLLLLPFGKNGAISENSPFIVSAGNRIYLNPTEMLYFSLPRRILPKALKNVDDMMAQALNQVLQRPEFQEQAKPKYRILFKVLLGWVVPIFPRAFVYLWLRKPEGKLKKMSFWIEKQILRAKQQLNACEKGADRLIVIQNFIGSFYQNVRPMLPILIAGSVSFKLLSALCSRWLGNDKDVALLARGLPGNVASEMGLVLGDLANFAHQYPDVISHLENCNLQTAFDNITEVEGGKIFMEKVENFLEIYGMRGIAEVDISRPRYREDPTLLVKAILNHCDITFGVQRERYKQFAIEAEEIQKKIISSARKTKFGFLKARILRRLIRVCRQLLGGREHPKFMLMQILGLFKEAILEEAQDLVEKGILTEVEDVYFLKLSELIQVAKEGSDVKQVIADRRLQHGEYEKMYPPRLLTSKGEQVIVPRREGNTPGNVLIGSPVSTGIVTGKAKVIHDTQNITLEAGEILVTCCTDPGWTPLFLDAAGLVMESGGMFTHGSVVIREYGIPAVAGVPYATSIIRSGQEICVNGSIGRVEILTEVRKSSSKDCIQEAEKL